MSEAATCELCGTPVPRGLLRRGGRTARFCCAGCLHVADILGAVPPERGRELMEQARRLGIIPASPDAPVEAEPRQPEPPSPDVPDEALRSERFAVDGYACPSCAWLVGAVVEQQPGVFEARADFFSDSLRVTYDMRRTGPDELSVTVRPLGYVIDLLASGDSPEEARFTSLLRRFVFALFLALNVMMLSAVHWASYLEDIPLFEQRSISLIQLVLVVPLAVIGVWPLLLRTLRMARHGRASMDLLLVLGFTAAFALSIAAFFVHEGEASFYFDTCAAFVAISLFGRLVEGKLRLRAARELRGILEVGATKVAVLGEMPSHLMYRAVDAVEPGERIRIEAGRYVPFDGEAEGQGGLVSEAMLTGEPTPVSKRPGDVVHAGSMALGDTLTLRVSRPYREGRLTQIADSIAQALTRTDLRLRSADRVASFFVPAVLLAAAVTLVLHVISGADGDWLATGPWSAAISVLLVACPCAFGIATASALAVGVSSLLGRGVLVKDSSALERFDSVDTVIFDKTGTLTTGLWSLVDVRWRGEAEPELLAAVLGAEAGLDHPVAHALAANLDAAPAAPDERQTLPGQGVRARFGDRWLTVGRPALFEDPTSVGDADDRTTVVHFGMDGMAAGCFLLKDALRPEAADVVAWLRSRGITCRVLSGDRQAVVDGVASRLGLDPSNAEGGLTPEDKRDRVRQLSRAGHRVAFVGDGSNDAPAMAESDVAVSLRHGTSLSLSTAHILPLRGDLGMLPPIHRAAAASHRVIRQNFGWAFGYNLVFLPLAALGYLHPIFAAGLMFSSSLTVLVNSLRLGRHVQRAFDSS